MKQYNKTIQKAINLDDVTKEDTKEHNRNWSQSSDYVCKILITGKTN